MKAVLLCHPKRLLVSTVEKLGLIISAAVPDRTDSVNYIFCRELEAGRDNGIARIALPYLIACRLKLVREQKLELRKLVEQAVMDREGYLKESIQMEKKVASDKLAYQVIFFNNTPLCLYAHLKSVYKTSFISVRPYRVLYGCSSALQRCPTTSGRNRKPGSLLWQSGGPGRQRGKYPSIYLSGSDTHR